MCDAGRRAVWLAGHRQAGAKNAGLLAVSILAATRPDLRAKLSGLPRRTDPSGARRLAAVKRIVLPGATLGVLGSGQLGRMFAIAARRMGYRVHTLSPGIDTPTGQVADLEIDADYDDLDAIRAFARGVDVITFEFETCPRPPRCRGRDSARRPTGHALRHAARGREKSFWR